VTTWQGAMWLNFEEPNGHKSVMRSDDEGVTWVHQSANGGMLSDGKGSQRFADGGPPHQGPILPQGDTALAM
jgi:hypothetical protein